MKLLRQMTRWGVALAAAGLLVAAPARAGIIFDVGPAPLNLMNIGSFDQNSATTATGFHLGTNDPIVDVATDTALTVPASGAARVEAASPAAPFTNILLTPTGLNFGILEFNLQIGVAGTFQLVALDQDGVSFTSPVFNLSNGVNRYFAQAINGQSISSVEVQVLTGGVGDIRQIRYSVIPEPASIVLGLMAAVPAGLVALRRRIRRPVA